MQNVQWESLKMERRGDHWRPKVGCGEYESPAPHTQVRATEAKQLESLFTTETLVAGNAEKGALFKQRLPIFHGASQTVLKPWGFSSLSYPYAIYKFGNTKKSVWMKLVLWGIRTNQVQWLDVSHPSAQNPYASFFGIQKVLIPLKDRSAFDDLGSKNLHLASSFNLATSMYQKKTLDLVWKRCGFVESVDPTNTHVLLSFDADVLLRNLEVAERADQKRKRNSARLPVILECPPPTPAMDEEAPPSAEAVPPSAETVPPSADAAPPSAAVVVLPSIANALGVSDEVFKGLEAALLGKRKAMEELKEAEELLGKARQRVSDAEHALRGADQHFASLLNALKDA